MNEKYIQILGIAATLVYAVFIVFLYASEPRSAEEISVKAKQTVTDAVSKGSVVIGTYEIDRRLFEQGMDAFRKEDYVSARDAFARADPERRDAATQFYTAYSYYRQGWGRVSNDDALFAQALESIDRVREIDPNFTSADPSLQLRTPAELRNEIEEGLKVTADDFNPLRIFRERK